MIAPEQTYPSKVDTWLVVVIVGMVVAEIAVAFFIMTLHLVGGIVCLVGVILISLLIALFMIPCHYTLTEDSLKIRCGMVKESIALSRITGVTATRNPLSAPALSLDRLRIELIGDDRTLPYRLISPKDRDKFVADLKSRVEAQRATTV